MVSHTKIRSATAVEMTALTKLLVTLPTPKKRFLKAALNTAVFSFFSAAGLCILWFIISLLLVLLINIDLGISSRFSSFIFGFIGLTSILIAVNSTKKWLKNTNNDYGLVAADLKANKTTEHTFIVKNVKCFKEPEHGGLLYFLLLIEHPLTHSNPNNGSTQAKVRAIYDYESQRSNLDGRSLIVVKEKIIITEAPISKFVFNTRFEGNPLNVGSPLALTSPPKLWPIPDSWCCIDWDKLESQYSRQNSQ